MKNLKLITSLDSFSKRIGEILIKDDIEFDNKVHSNEDLVLLKKRIKLWQDEMFNIFGGCFSDNEGYFRSELTPIDDPIYSRIETINNKTIQQKRDFIIKIYNQQKDFVFDFCNILPVLDKINNNKNIFDLEYANPSEIIYLILGKLKCLKNGECFRIDLILKGNGIELKNGIQEFFEYKYELEKNKWVDFEDNYLGRITLKGEIYLEKQNKIFLKKESDLISKRIDLIVSKMESLGHGQEILFEELEELKGLYSKLNKKNWSQLVKGKIIDLAISKVIDKSVIDFLATELLGNENSLKFLKS